MWEAEIGEQLGQPMKHERVNSARFSPDGKWVLTASADGTARVWNAEWEASPFGPGSDTADMHGADEGTDLAHSVF